MTHGLIQRPHSLDHRLTVERAAQTDRCLVDHRLGVAQQHPFGVSVLGGVEQVLAGLQQCLQNLQVVRAVAALRAEGHLQQLVQVQFADEYPRSILGVSDLMVGHLHALGQQHAQHVDRLDRGSRVVDTRAQRAHGDLDDLLEAEEEVSVRILLDVEVETVEQTVRAVIVEFTFDAHQRVPGHDEEAVMHLHGHARVVIVENVVGGCDIQRLEVPRAPRAHDGPLRVVRPSRAMAVLQLTTARAQLSESLFVDAVEDEIDLDGERNGTDEVDEKAQADDCEPQRQEDAQARYVNVVAFLNGRDQHQ